MRFNLGYKGTGSSLTGSEWNNLVDCVKSGLNSIVTGSCVISGTTMKVLSPAGTGSPVTWGRYVEGGSGTTSAGSILWVVFGTSFTITPYTSITGYDDPTPVAFTGSPVTAGSMRVVSTGASKNFSWIGIG